MRLVRRMEDEMDIKEAKLLMGEVENAAEVVEKVSEEGERLREGNTNLKQAALRT